MKSIWYICTALVREIHIISYRYKSGQNPMYYINGLVEDCSQGWGQFHFFNSIPIPVFSIPIPIPLLTISFNSNSNSGDFNSNSNSNSGISNPGNLNSRNDLLMPSLKLIIIILKRYVYIKLLLSIPSVSYPLLNGYNCMASWLILYQ